MSHMFSIETGREYYRFLEKNLYRCARIISNPDFKEQFDLKEIAGDKWLEVFHLPHRFPFLIGSKLGSHQFSQQPELQDYLRVLYELDSEDMIRTLRFHFQHIDPISNYEEEVRIKLTDKSGLLHCPNFYNSLGLYNYIFDKKEKN